MNKGNRALRRVAVALTTLSLLIAAIVSQIGTSLASVMVGATGAFPSAGAWTTGASIAIDSAGGLHMAFGSWRPDVNGNYPGFYAYCPGAQDCSDDSKWQSVQVTDAAGPGAYRAQIKLNASDQPRVMFATDQVLPDHGQGYLYAECNSNCLTGASWAKAKLYDNGSLLGSAGEERSSHSFTLDVDGFPVLMFTGKYTDEKGAQTGSFLAFCSALPCGLAANWKSVHFSERAVNSLYDYGLIDENSSLALTKAGGIRVLSLVASPTPGTGGDSYLTYISCDAACGSPSSWTKTYLKAYYAGVVSAQLVLDSQDRPRLIWQSGILTSGGTKADQHREYGWCNTDCTNVASWSFKDTGIQAANKTFGDVTDMALALDSADKPHVAYSDGTYLGYAECTANCESASGAWTFGPVESDAELQADRRSVTVGWFPGHQPAITLRGGKIVIAHTALDLGRYVCATAAPGIPEKTCVGEANRLARVYIAGGSLPPPATSTTMGTPVTTPFGAVPRAFVPIATK